jgi:hypothetical protein
MHLGLVLSIGAGAVAVVGGVLALVFRRRTDPLDLGSVSASWMAEQRFGRAHDAGH